MPIREFTKEQVVLLYFLVHGNNWVNADAIVRWVNGEEPGKSIGALNDRSQIPFTLSRAGAVKICKRLVPDTLESMTTTGYRSKKVILYRLAESYNGYFTIVQRLKQNPIIFIESEYGKQGVEKYLIGEVEKKNAVVFDTLRDKVVWAFRHSPTALMLGIEGVLAGAETSNGLTPEQRLDACVATLACAIRVDSAFKDRRHLLQDSGELAFFKSVLR